MFYSGNLTKKEMVSAAMPIMSLSREQWNSLLKHIKQVEQNEPAESVLVKTLEKISSNQAKLEVISRFFDSYIKEIDDPVNEESVCLYPII